MIKKKLINNLKKNNLKLCVAESITGGRFSSEIIKIKGASSFLDLSIISYSNDSKHTFYSLKKKIHTFGVVSSEVAEQMAKKVVSFSNKKNRIGISCTGLASKIENSGGIKVGTVFIGIFYKKKIKVIKKEFDEKKTRNQIILATTSEMFYQANSIF